MTGQVQLIVCLLVASTSATSLLTDNSPIRRHCIGPGCPTISLPVDTFEEASKNDSTIKCTDAETTIPDPSNCQHFFACNNGTAHKLKCTLGYAYHPKLEVCVPETLVKSCGKIYCPPTIILGLVPDPKDCTRYYRCIYGIPMHLQCDKGAIYDDELGKCTSYDEDGKPACVGSEGGKPVVSTSTTEPNSSNAMEELETTTIAEVFSSSGTTTTPVPDDV